jgi:hypothetical protein
MISKKAQGMSSGQHIAKSINVGASGERRFYDSCKAAGMNIKKTGKKSDIAHVDFIVKDKVTFDVKGLKDSHKNGNILLELKNVQGKKGWCNDQNTPEWIAFDFGIFFVCAKNTHLYELTKKICNLRSKVSKAKDCLYKGYTRKDRKDLMTMVKLSDVLAECDHWILPYKEYRQPMELLRP